MKSLGDARATLVADDFSFDDSIRTRFTNETAEILQEIDRILPKWAEKPDDLALLSRIRRNFYALSVSSSRVGANTVNNVSLVIQELLDEVFNNNIDISKDLIKLLNETKYVMPFLVDDFAHKTEASSDPAIIILKAENLRLKRDAYAGLDIEEKTENDIPLQVPPPVKIVTRFVVDEDDDEEDKTEEHTVNSALPFPNQSDDDDIVSIIDDEINHDEPSKQQNQNIFGTPIDDSQKIADKDNFPILAEVEYPDNDIHNFSRSPNEKIIISDINERKTINYMALAILVIVILLVTLILVLLFK